MRAQLAPAACCANTATYNGYADATLVALAEELETPHVLRPSDADFRTYRWKTRCGFKIYPPT